MFWSAIIFKNQRVFSKHMGNKERKVEDLPLIDDYKEARGLLERSVLTSQSLVGRANIFAHVTQLYKALYESLPEGEERASVLEEAQYFLDKAFEYKEQFDFNHDMLPDFFNRDMPWDKK
jgi:hypothetical protein